MMFLLPCIVICTIQMILKKHNLYKINFKVTENNYLYVKSVFVIFSGDMQVIKSNFLDYRDVILEFIGIIVTIFFFN